MGVGMMQSKRRILMDTPHIVTPTAAELHTFNTDMMALLRECRVHFSPVQEGTGDPNPVDNIRLIHGWTGLDLYRTNQNLFTDIIYLSDHGINSAGEIIENSAYDVYKQNLEPGTYTIIWGDSNSSANKSLRVVDLDITGNVLSVTERSYTSANNRILVFTVNDSAVTVLFSIRNSVENARIVVGESDNSPEYVDSNALIRQIDWSTIGEIPGGYVDLVQNALVVDTFYLVFDGTEDWKRNGSVSSKYYYYVNIPEQAVVGNCICSHEVQKSLSINNTTLGCNIANVSNVMSFLIRLNADTGAMSSLDDFKAWVASQYSNGTPLTAVGTLETPIVYPLNPITPIKTLRGLNNIWSNANGNIELSYWTH